MTNEGIPIQIITKGFIREGDPSVDPTFVPNAIDQYFQHWITPQLGESVDRDSITKALIVLDGSEAHVTVNDDVRFWAIAGEQDEIVDPTECFVGQITSLLPDGVDPRLRWMGFATAIGGRALPLDLVGNIDRVTPLLGRAHDFLRSAKMSLDADLLAPSVEQLFSAAELSVMTLIQLDGWDDKRNHKNRDNWIKAQVTDRKVPESFGDIYSTLYSNRNSARYGEDELTFDIAEAEDFIGTIGHMIEFARSRRNDLSHDDE
ncbi:HEPN domain-containing protein [Rhodococcus sp. WY5]|uniref:HEPN domain-containing protein n=1 Tax=Rhodococcus sp. WY5 TaxID=2708349 RepID=UPI001BDEBA8D|nr:HEPN domain-containing protein [Rhodococcus sp. WY5]